VIRYTLLGIKSPLDWFCASLLDTNDISWRLQMKGRQISDIEDELRAGLNESLSAFYSTRRIDASYHVPFNAWRPARFSAADSEYRIALSPE